MQISNGHHITLFSTTEHGIVFNLDHHIKFEHPSLNDAVAATSEVRTFALLVLLIIENKLQTVVSIIMTTI
jgi:hypothetical protein